MQVQMFFESTGQSAVLTGPDTSLTKQKNLEKLSEKKRKKKF